MTDVETGCYVDVRSARTVDIESSAVESRAKCGVCLSDGIARLFVGKQSANVHSTGDFEELIRRGDA